MLKWLLTFIRERQSRLERLASHERSDHDVKRRVEKEYGVRFDTPSIEDYRNRFRTAPIGNWSQAVGTFGAVMDEHGEFRADGTGRIMEMGPFGGERGETLFEWKPVSDFCISCLITQRPWDDEDEEEVEDEPEEWETIRYDFRVVSSDCGNTIALFEVDEKGVPFEGFWLSSTPLSRS